MLTISIYIAYLAIALAMTFCMARIMRGPHPADRVLAFDTLYINTVAFLIVLDIHLFTSLFFDAALLIALTGFVATAALARYVARGRAME